jgi:hypothetical protein
MAKYLLTVDTNDFDLDEDRSIVPTIERTLKQGGCSDADVDGVEVRNDQVVVNTEHSLDRVLKCLEDDGINAEGDEMKVSEATESSEEYKKTAPGHFKTDDFTTQKKKYKSFRYVPAKQGDNPLEETEDETVKRLQEEYKTFKEKEVIAIDEDTGLPVYKD